MNCGRVSDVSPPVMACPANITVTADKDSYNAKLSWDKPAISGHLVSIQ